MANWRTHPEESDLLRYCDGELRAGETARVARHLEACWECRTGLDDLKQTIAEYVRYQRDVLEPALPRPPAPWKNLYSEFPAAPPPKRIFHRPAVWLVACTLTAGTGIWFYAGQAPRPPQPLQAASTTPAPVPRKAQAAPVAVKAVAEPGSEPRPSGSGPEDELAVIAALDQIGADLGDPIEVVRTRDRIVVTCIGLDARRMAQVRATLSGLPRVSVVLSPKPGASVTGSPLDVVGAPRAGLRTGIARQFDSPAAYESFVDALLKNSEAMMARAHALRALASRFPADIETSLNAASEARLTGIRQRHMAALAAEVSALANSVEPYVARSEVSPAVHSATEDWQERALRVFAEAEQVDRLLGAVFAGSQGAATGDATPAALWTVLAKLETDVAP